VAWGLSGLAVPRTGHLLITAFETTKRDACSQQASRTISRTLDLTDLPRDRPAPESMALADATSTWNGLYWD
jgi:hypothetical protein